MSKLKMMNYPHSFGTSQKILSKLQKGEPISFTAGKRDNRVLVDLLESGFLQTKDPDYKIEEGYPLEPGPIWLEILKIEAAVLHDSEPFYLSWNSRVFKNLRISQQVILDPKKLAGKNAAKQRRMLNSMTVIFQHKDLIRWKADGFLREIELTRKGHPMPDFARKIKNRILDEDASKNLEGFIDVDIEDIMSFLDYRQQGAFKE